MAAAALIATAALAGKAPAAAMVATAALAGKAPAAAMVATAALAGKAPAAALVATTVVAVALARRVMRDAARLGLVAEAEHELRGALQGIAIARHGAGVQADLTPEIDRARAALADLAEARSGRRAEPQVEDVHLDRLVWQAATASDLAARRVGGGVHLDWSAGPVVVQADRGRLAQAFANLLSNAIEHGGGQVRVIGRRTRQGVRVEVRDGGRGHGLEIAAKAVRESGGSLMAARAGEGTAMTIDLPVQSPPAPQDASASEAPS